jgi:hypothetical protein
MKNSIVTRVQPAKFKDKMSVKYEKIGLQLKKIVATRKM